MMGLQSEERFGFVLGKSQTPLVCKGDKDGIGVQTRVQARGLESEWSHAGDAEEGPGLRESDSAASMWSGDSSVGHGQLHAGTSQTQLDLSI